ncbi:hypothetical protein QTI66_20225 [Variovorax sp. J22R133]|uniref:hypothetical protein n=1 Tax=Variovorax brevis TaxID=3053503 RepID=UPI002575131F|nr:hypothetical protein [Variovorax sp. J22R133]MDM0114490.1 hypothetical protein [Variovorax sp. J22R133]
MSASYVPARWPAPVATAFVWALAAASVAYWGLKLGAPPDSAAPPAVANGPVAVDSADVAKGLGAVTRGPTALAPEAGSRFVLLGVVSDGDQRGAALIAVDGKPPRPFRVGQVIGDGYVLQSVNKRAAALGTRVGAPTSLTLQLPKPAAATGVSSASLAASPPRVPNFAPVMAPGMAPGTVPSVVPNMGPGVGPAIAPVVPATPTLPADGG